MKVEEDEYPELPLTEYICNQIFKLLSITVPPHFLVRFEGEKSCFVTENFMHHAVDANLIHLYHFFGNAPYSCETILKIIEEKVGRIAAQENFVTLTLADSLIGNNDRHGRNIAFIQTTNGYELSPFYDNISYIAIELAALLDADHQPTGTIATTTTKTPSMKEYVQEWRRLGFGYIVEQFYNTMSLDTINTLVANSHLSIKRQKSLLRLINKRSRELC